MSATPAIATPLGSYCCMVSRSAAYSSQELFHIVTFNNKMKPDPQYIISPMISNQCYDVFLYRLQQQDPCISEDQDSSGEDPQELRQSEETYWGSSWGGQTQKTVTCDAQAGVLVGVWVCGSVGEGVGKWVGVLSTQWGQLHCCLSNDILCSCSNKVNDIINGVEETEIAVDFLHTTSKIHCLQDYMKSHSFGKNGWEKRKGRLSDTSFLSCSWCGAPLQDTSPHWLLHHKSPAVVWPLRPCHLTRECQQACKAEYRERYVTDNIQENCTL